LIVKLRILCHPFETNKFKHYPCHQYGQDNKRSLQGVDLKVEGQPQAQAAKLNAADKTRPATRTTKITMSSGFVTSALTRLYKNPVRKRWLARPRIFNSFFGCKIAHDGSLPYRRP
jgi:hypothetical protein